jgi:hypothetical protein
MRYLSVLFAIALVLEAQTVTVRGTDEIRLRGVSDSNSPMHWNSNGKLVVFQSDGMPVRSEGDGLASQDLYRAVRLYSYKHTPMWIEATWLAPDGRLYAWYHHEIFLNCEEAPLSMPVIGALRSDDDGITFHDLGIVLSPAGEPDCGAKNGYFAGGHGDFTVIADENSEYLYFVFSNYSGPAERQGIVMARMRIEDREEPVDKVFKFFEDAWEQPGLGGEVSPVIGVSRGWSEEDTNALWGPAIHYNEHLEKYVVIMNHACCSPGWPQEGLYASFVADLSKPQSWSQPVKILDGVGWYPMVVGSTDKRAGKTARLFTGSLSLWEIEFAR